jgi:hypothetical protein
VRVSQVLEAGLSPLRQVIFLSYLLKGKPLSPAALSERLDRLFNERGDLYGLGRNRQGRPAFVFRKKKSTL